MIVGRRITHIAVMCGFKPIKCKHIACLMDCANGREENAVWAERECGTTEFAKILVKTWCERVKGGHHTAWLCDR